MTREVSLLRPFGDKVVDSREKQEGDVIRRRRQCLNTECQNASPATSGSIPIQYMVVKKDGKRERFERQKLVAGLLKACEKRPVSVAAIEDVADRVEVMLQERPEKEIATAEIGAFVMQELKQPRQSCLRALCLGLPPLPRHRRVHERIQGSAECQRVIANTVPDYGKPRTKTFFRSARCRRGAGAARPFRDNPRLIVAGIGVLLAALVGILCSRSAPRACRPISSTEVVLYALSATNLMMLLALGFVLARNVIKLLVERRRAMPFVRFRAKLVFMLLGMTLIPDVLVLIVGSNVVLAAVDQWFNEPVDEVLSSANQIAADYYRERQRSVSQRSVAPGPIAGAAHLTATDVRAFAAS